MGLSLSYSLIHSLPTIQEPEDSKVSHSYSTQEQWNETSEGDGKHPEKQSHPK